MTKLIITNHNRSVKSHDGRKILRLTGTLPAVSYARGGRRTAGAIQTEVCV